MESFKPVFAYARSFSFGPFSPLATSGFVGQSSPITPSELQVHIKKITVLKNAFL
jgi:hypothetical protein